MNSNTMKFLADEILPEKMISVLIGASGTGKTTWILQVLEAMARGALAFGRFGTKPIPQTFFVSLDRTSEELELKFRAITLPPDKFKYAGYRRRLQEKGLLQTIFREMPEGTELIILDGIGFVVEKVISQFHVGQAVAELDKLRAPLGLTLVIIHHTPKIKGAEGYADPREKGLGSGAWCQMAATAVVFEKLAPGDVKNPYRRVWVLQSDVEDQELAFKLTNRLEWLPNGFPEAETAKTWSLQEIMKRFGCGMTKAREIYSRIQGGEDPDLL